MGRGALYGAAQFQLLCFENVSGSKSSSESASNSEFLYSYTKTDHPSIRIITRVCGSRWTITIISLDGWSLCLPVFIHRRIFGQTIVLCPSSSQADDPSLV